MKLQLQLLRHAKSSWLDAGMADFDRPLAPRGQRAGLTMGEVIFGKGLLPDLVLCSPARRAVQTWQAVSSKLPQIPPSAIIETLYDFGDGSALLEAIRLHNRGAKALMLVGHNPSIENLARRLIGHGPSKLRQRLEDKFPTGALAVIEFSVDQWSQITDKTGTLKHFLRPADVAGDT